MKTLKNYFARQLFMLVGIVFLFSGCEDIDDTNSYINIPDDAFFSGLLQLGVDSDGDDEISREEAEKVSYLDLTGLSMESLAGIEAFVNLDTLICYETGISEMDLSENMALIFLSCGLNKISSLNVTNNTKLTFLSCYDNQLTGLDVSNNTALTRFDCNRNQLSTLDVTSNSALRELSIADNQLTSLDVSNNTDLLRLDINRNQLINLDVTANTDLTNLWCIENQLTNLDVSNNTNLKELDIRKMPTLEKVCVWTMPFPSAGVEVYTTESPNVDFTMDCNN